MIETNYMGLLSKVMNEGIEELNQRTGIRTARLLGAVVDLDRSMGIFSPRKMSVRIAAAECAWMLSGDKSTTWLNRHTSIWKKFEDETSPGVISTAYGFRWRYAFRRNQIQEAIDLLKKDPSTRQALVMSWDPYIDGLMNQGKSKNVPCPFAFSLYVKDGHGHAVVYQRSADVVIGIPYDLMVYYLVSQAIFNSAQYSFWGLRIMIGDAHVYANQYDVARRMMAAKSSSHPHYFRHSWTVADIVEAPDEFVSNFAGVYKGIEWPVTDKLEAAQ